MKRSVEDNLKELCLAHDQLSETIGAKDKGSGASKVLMNMWSDQLKELEENIISTLKSSFSRPEKPLKKVDGDQRQQSLIEEKEEIEEEIASPQIGQLEV